MRWYSSLLALVTLCFVLATGAFAEVKKGDSVEVEWKGSFYPAKILEVKDGKYKIHYDGYADSWDEWVTTARIKGAAPAARSGGAYKAGDALEVEWKGKWYPAKILEVKDGKYKIHYDGYESSWDEWVTTARMRGGATWKVGDPLQVQWKGQWYPASIIEVKDGKYKIHYDGYDASWDEWIGTDRMKKR
jgi:uncharacterized protein with FMN-binding domain